MKNSFISAVSILLVFLSRFRLSFATSRGRKMHVKGVRSRKLQKGEEKISKGPELGPKDIKSAKEGTAETIIEDRISKGIPEINLLGKKSAKGKGNQDARIQGTLELKANKSKCKKGASLTNVNMESLVKDEQGLPLPPAPIECDEKNEYDAGMKMFSQIERNCDAIANDVGPTTTPWISFVVIADVVKDERVKMKTVYKAMEEELQKYVAPIIAGCDDEDNTSDRKLKETNIVHVDFQSLEHNRDACHSSLAIQANAVGDACLSTDVPVTVYYLGEGDSDKYLSQIQENIKNYKWNTTGVKETDVIEVAITGSSEDATENSRSLPIPAIGAVAAFVVAFVVIFFCYRRRSRYIDPPMARAVVIDNNDKNNKKVKEIDTESETDDEKEKQFYPRAVAEPIYNAEESAIEIKAC